MSLNRKMLTIHTDGASNPKTNKAAGWGFCFFPTPDSNKPVVHSGYIAPPSTNNVGELTAVIAAIEFTQKFNGYITLFTDSEYAKRCFYSKEKWLREGMPPKNNELILNLWRVVEESNAKIEVRWCKGHNGVVGNEIADFAAGCGKMLDPKFFGKSAFELKYGIDLGMIHFNESYDHFLTYMSDKNLRK